MAAGGAVVAQDQESCAVYGMPKAVVTAGLADVVLPLDTIGEVLSRGEYRRQVMP
jgi:two-component system chemotaxis response regulator CheB